MTTIRAPKGTFDLIPPSSAAFNRVRAQFGESLRHAGYAYVETPAFEDTALFVRGVGESTDIVTKEMYTFQDKGDRSITLRPEGTAPVLRAVLEHGLHRAGVPVKLWYFGSFFRYERPQAGRTRQFHQVGAEAIGTEDPLLDVELIALAVEGYQQLGLRQVRMLLNTLGCAECRPVYRAALQQYLRALELDEDTLRRVEVNPLRVLDDKRPEVQAQLRDAPVVTDYLDEACRAYHEAVRTALKDLGIGFEDEPRLVRGLDYYTRTTFEFVHDGLGAQSAIGGGGRYDGLSEQLGGPALPSVGWALGIGRILLALEAESVALDDAVSCDVYVVPLGDQARRWTLALVTELRRGGVSADMAYGGRGLKGSMKSADRSGAPYAVVVGERDLQAGVAQVKDLRSGEQSAVPLADLTTHLHRELSATEAFGQENQK